MTRPGGSDLPPLRARAELYRAHGLGNDYLVFEAAPEVLPGWLITPGSVRAVCDRHRGAGSDGIVILLNREPTDGVFPLRMFNPDGSEFERSGNGLRVLASFLHGEGLVTLSRFVVRSGGSEISMTVHAVGPGGEYDVSVDMGRVRVGAEAVPLDSSHLDANGCVVHPELGPIAFVPVSVGNPHAVVFASDGSGPTSSPWHAGSTGSVGLPGAAAEHVFREVGPFLSTHPAFPEGTNVQLVEEVSGGSAPGAGLEGAGEELALAESDGLSGRIRIRIWERGVGPTTASGTSSCAAAAAAVATGRLEGGRVRVAMEGGDLIVLVGPDLEVTLRGPVRSVARGRLTPGFVEALGAG